MKSPAQRIAFPVLIDSSFHIGKPNRMLQLLILQATIDRIEFVNIPGQTKFVFILNRGTSARSPSSTIAIITRKLFSKSQPNYYQHATHRIVPPGFSGKLQIRAPTLFI